MLYLNSIIFGIIQGLTEFLPVSSSGHLVILHSLLSLPLENELVFDVALHLATLLAVLIFFREDIKNIIDGWIKSLKGEASPESRLGWLIIAATLPAAFIGYFFEEAIEAFFRSGLIVAIMLVLVALLFLAAERCARQNKGLDSLDLPRSLMIGLAQSLALIPGTSRSGITIIAGLALGLKRVEAIRFSFLLSLPVILGANIKKIPLLFSGNLAADEFLFLGLAFVFAFASGFLAIKYFLRFASRHRLDVFAYYRIILALVIALFLL